MNRLLVLLLAPVILFGTAMPVRAQNRPSGVDLTVCNKGTVPVEVVAAEKNEPVLGVGKLYWNIRGKTVVPGKCAVVFGSTIGLPAFIAFGFDDAQGQWGSGHISHVPDFGVFARWFHSNKVLVGAAQSMCVRRNEYRYSVDGDIPADCAGMTSANAPDARHGPFIPLTAALFFETDNQYCGTPQYPQFCSYYLNISPSASGRELHAMIGSPSGEDVAENADDSAGIRFLRALAKAALEEHQKEVKAAADTVGAGQRRLVERAAAREQQQKDILAADAAGNPNVKVEAQMIRREDENNRQRWAGTRQSPAAYDPQWMGQNMVIVGTVSRVEVDPNGEPHWVSIYFKESPDATVVVCSPYPDLFQERIGQNLSALVGKTLEAAGQVESPYCGKDKVSKASIRVVESKQWQVH